MKPLRRILGVFVMAAGVVGLILSIAGLAGLFIIRPALSSSLELAVDTLYTSVESSQKTLALTDGAMDAAINSVDSLAEMLSTTRLIVEDTQPVITQFNEVLGGNLPETFDTAGESLKAAQSAASSLESAIKSFETFQTLLSGFVLLSGGQPQEQTVYDPDTSLADSLGDLSTSIEEMPDVFEGMAKDLDQADNNLDNVQESLDAMAKNITRISADLEQYRAMLSNSRGSMDELQSLLGGLRENLPGILNTASLVLGLFFLWLLAAQVVIFSQGWELYHGTAGRMEPAPIAARAVPHVEKPADVLVEVSAEDGAAPADTAQPAAAAPDSEEKPVKGRSKSAKG